MRKIEDLKLYARVDKEQIGYLCTVLESYEGLAVMRTINQKDGIVEFLVSSSFEKEILLLIEELKEELYIEIIQKPNSGG